MSSSRAYASMYATPPNNRRIWRNPAASSGADTYCNMSAHTIKSYGPRSRSVFNVPKVPCLTSRVSPNVRTAYSLDSTPTYWIRGRMRFSAMCQRASPQPTSSTVRMRRPNMYSAAETARWTFRSRARSDVTRVRGSRYHRWK